MLSDFGQALRSVRRQAKFSILIGAILALGIAATTLVFGIDAVAFLNGVIPNPERLGWIFGVDTRHANNRAGVSLPDYLDFRERTQSFESLGARTGGTVTLTGRGQASRLGAMLVTADFLDIWGLRVESGRGFRRGEDQPGSARVAVVSNRLWKTTLAGNPSIVGSDLTLDGIAHTVVGVLEPRLDTVFASVDMWLPLDLAAARKAPRDARSLLVVGVLKPGVTVAHAHSEVHALALQLAAEHPQTNSGWDARVVDTRTGRTGPQTYYNLGLLSIGAGLVLLNACVIVALLLMSRGLARQKEFSVRLAIGAGWYRIARQNVLEGLVIAIPAALAGIGLAMLALKLLQMSADPYYKRVAIDSQFMEFGVAISLLTPVMFGCVPAWQLLRGRRPLTTGAWAEVQYGATGRRTQRLLAMTQLGAALILLIVSGIVLQSLLASIRTDVGFDTSRVMTVGLSLPTWKYPDRATLPDAFKRLVDRVASVPGISSAAASTTIPSLTAAPSVPAQLEAEVPRSAGPEAAQLAVITPGVFETVGVEVTSGRSFSVRDTAKSPLVAMVNRQFAARYGTSPREMVGRHLAIRGESQWREIVGVVGNTRNSLDGQVAACVFLPSSQEPQRTMFLLARVPEGEGPESIRRALADADPDVAPYQLRTVKLAIQLRQSGDRALFGLFGVLALVSGMLAASGLFGVFSCLVSQRRRDFAVRLALGASPNDVSRILFRDAALTVIPAVLLGVLGGALLARFAIGVVYGITANPYDVTVYAGSIVLLLVAAAAALLPPARRVRSIRVAEVLRGS